MRNNRVVKLGESEFILSDDAFDNFTGYANYNIKLNQKVNFVKNFQNHPQFDEFMQNVESAKIHANQVLIKKTKKTKGYKVRHIKDYFAGTILSSSLPVISVNSQGQAIVPQGEKLLKIQWEHGTIEYVKESMVEEMPTHNCQEAEAGE